MVVNRITTMGGRAGGGARSGGGGRTEAGVSAKAWAKSLAETSEGSFNAWNVDGQGVTYSAHADVLSKSAQKKIKAIGGSFNSKTGQWSLPTMYSYSQFKSVLDKMSK